MERSGSDFIMLNFEINNFYEAITDANQILSWDENNYEVKRVRTLSLIFSKQDDLAKDYVNELYDYNKYRILQFLFKEVAIVLARDEFAKGLRILEIIDSIDKDNPIKLLKEANIFGLAGDKEKQDEILKRIDSIFPKYFVSHFRFSDMYQDKDLLEISFLLELEIFDKQGLFLYPFRVLEGYKNHLEGHIIDSKECFEKAIRINPEKPEGYVLLAQTLQLMSGNDNPEHRAEAVPFQRLKERLKNIKKNLNFARKIKCIKLQWKFIRKKTCKKKLMI